LITTDGTDGYLVEKIDGHRYRKGVLQFKVIWMDSIKPSFEPASELIQVRGLIDIYLRGLSRSVAARLREGL